MRNPISGVSEDLREAKTDIADLIIAERMARYDGNWDRMASFWHSDSSVELTWFQGSGAAFVGASNKVVNPNSPNFHMMAPSLITLNGDRAVAETPCTVLGFARVGEVECCVDSFVRLMWRVRRDEGRWLLAGLRCLYIRDMMQPCDPTTTPRLDEAKLTRFRLSYRYAAYHSAEAGVEISDDMAGTDRPDTVTALRAGEERWLAAV